MKNKKIKIWSFLVLVVAVLSVFTFLKGVKVNSSIMDILPNTKPGSEWEKPLVKFEDKLNSNFLFIILADSMELAEISAAEVNARLVKSNLFKSVNYKVNTSEFESLYNTYYPHRAKLMTQKQKLIFRSGQQDIWVKQTVAELYSPFGSLAAANLQGDPLGLFREFISQLGGGGQLENKDGLMVADYKGDVAIFISAEVNNNLNEFESKSLTLVKELKTSVKNKFGSQLLSTSPALYFADGAERSMAESALLTFLAITLIIIIFLYFFSSLTPLLVSILTILFSSLSGFVVTHFIFSEIHIMSMLLSISLLGIVADYCIHYFVHINNGADNKSVINKIKRPMLYGLITSIFGYMLLFLSNLSILKQMSVFASVGLFVGFITVISIFPTLNISPFKQRSFLNITGKLSPKVFIILISCCSLLVVMSLLFGLVSFDDDVKKLQKPSMDLSSDEIIIKDILAYNNTGTYYLVRGKSTLELLKNEEDFLGKTNVRGSAMSNYIPSYSSQEESLRAYLKLEPTILNLYNKLNIKYKFDMPDTKNYIEPEELMGVLKQLPIYNQWLGVFPDSNYYSSVVLFEEIGKSVKGNPNVLKVNKTAQVSTYFEKLRKTLINYYLILLVIIFILFTFKFNFKNSLKLILPPVVSVGVSLVVCSLLSPLNIFNILACVLVFTLGVDYTLFYFYSGNKNLVSKSIFISVLTTISSFGILFISETQAISSFGATVFMGMIMVYILSPVAKKPIECSKN